MTPTELRSALVELGWTQARLAEETGRTLRAAQAWCLGETDRIPVLVERFVSERLREAQKVRKRGLTGAQ